MAKLELTKKLKDTIEKSLKKFDFTKFDEDFKEKLDNYLLNDDKYIEFEDVKKFQELFNQIKSKTGLLSAR
jgi:hypothetical protein